MRAAAADVEKTSFVCPFGKFVYFVAPFGLTNLLSQYSKLMEQIFRSSIGRIVAVYLDDIVVCSATKQDHIAYLT